jgi:hypothetical protein
MMIGPQFAPIGSGPSDAGGAAYSPQQFYDEQLRGNPLLQPVSPFNFIRSYGDFLPLMSNIPFGSSWTANLSGSSAMLQGGLLPSINQMYAQSFPENFPTQLYQGAVDQLNVTGKDAATGGAYPALDPNSRLGQFFGKLGIGFFGIMLVLVGVIYLGLTIYARSQDKTVSELAKDAAKNAAKVGEVAAEA